MVFVPMYPQCSDELLAAGFADLMWFEALVGGGGGKDEWMSGWIRRKKKVGVGLSTR